MVKVITYWILILALMFVALLWPATSSHNPSQNTSLINRLDAPTNRFFRDGTGFSLDLQGINELGLQIDTAGLDLSTQRLLSISALQKPPALELSLRWTDEADAIHHASINDGWLSATWVDFGPGAVNDLTLWVMKNTNMGFPNSESDEMGFSQINLSSPGVTDLWRSNFSAWLDFRPIALSSINAQTPQSLSQNLTLRLGLWLMLGLILARLFKVNSRSTILSVLALAWISNSIPYWLNTQSQKHQINQAFAENNSDINQLDTQMREVANVIKSEFSNQRIAIIGNASFERLRLMHHLSSLNVGLVTLPQDITNQEPALWVFVNSGLEHCEPNQSSHEVIQQAELIIKDPIFCVLKP